MVMKSYSRILYAEVPRERIALFRFLLEAYDNLALMSVVDRYRAVIKIRCTDAGLNTVRNVLHAEGAKIIELDKRPSGKEKHINTVVPG